jgi:hypothetical protein
MNHVHGVPSVGVLYIPNPLYRSVVRASRPNGSWSVSTAATTASSTHGEGATRNAE